MKTYTIGLAVFAAVAVVLMGSMAVPASAGTPGIEDYSGFWAQGDQGTAQRSAGEIREPMETGAVPDLHQSSVRIDSNRPGEEQAVGAVEFGGLKYRSIDLGA